MGSLLEIKEAAEKHYRIDEEKKSIRVCAYCRVSTDKSDQRNSFKSQKAFFQDEFKRHSNWTACEIFADEGISGTSLLKRDEFNRMISLAMSGNYDLIITKEVSRFSRNVKDILDILLSLREKKVYVWFMAENINTEDDTYRQKITAASTQAENESFKTSNRVLWGQRRQMLNGVVFGRREMYGYNIVRDEMGQQHFEIIENEAAIVRRVFQMYADGYGTFKIARRLENEGIPTKRESGNWSNTVILRMLRNEKYVGDLCLGKTYTPDPLTHKKKYNRGQRDSFYFRDHHPDSAIISRELWDKVSALLEANTTSDAQKEKHSNRYWCSGKIICGECGQRYVSHIKHLKSGHTYKCWKCIEGQQRGRKKTITLENGQSMTVGCTSESVNDLVLREAVYDIIINAIKPRIETYCKEIMDDFKSKVSKNPSESERKAKAVQKKIEKVQQSIVNLAIKFADGLIDEQIYQMAKEQKTAELQELQQEIKQLSAENYGRITLEVQRDKQIETLRSLLSLKDDAFNEELFGRLVKKIVVHNGHILELYFSPLAKPIWLRYKAHGRLENYATDFTIINENGEAL